MNKPLSCSGVCSIVRLGSLLLAVPMLFVGCGDSEETAGVAIEGAEYAYVMPSAIDGDVVSFDFRNSGREVHEFLLVRLPDGRSLGELKAALQQQDSRIPSWVDRVGGVPLLSSGEEVRLTQELDDGRYALVCTFPSQKGVPHWKLGMISEFRVSGESGRELPEADATITAYDDRMDVPSLDAGKHVLKLVNAASQPRAFELVTFKPENRRKILPWAANGFKGKPPATFLGISQAVPRGTVQYAEVELEAGQIYVFLDDESGIRHEFIPR